MTTRFALFLCLALVPAAASAAPAAPAKAPATDVDADAAARKASKGPVTIYEFEKDTVGGESLKPDHEPIYRRMVGSHESLIRVRTHFIPQMLHMADDV